MPTQDEKSRAKRLKRSFEIGSSYWCTARGDRTRVRNFDKKILPYAKLSKRIGQPESARRDLSESAIKNFATIFDLTTAPAP